MKIKMMFLAFLLAGMGIYAQDIRVQVSPALTKCLPGVPVDLTISVANAGKEDVWIAAENLRQGIEIKEKGFLGKGGETLDCSTLKVHIDYAPPISGHHPDHPLKVKVPLKAGETFKISKEVHPGAYCPVSRDLTGLWKGEIEISIPVAEGDLESSVKRTVVVKEYQVEIRKLEGDDLAYFNALKSWMAKADPKKVDLGEPLIWRELLRSLKIPNEQIKQMLSQEYSGSTYAGYSIVRYGPGCLLKDASKMDQKKFDASINNDCGAFSEAEQEERRKKVKLDYSDFIKKARSFLATHPDFPREDYMRHQIACALFETDNPNEAWMEVKTLAMLEGQAADDARALLAEKCQPPSPKKNPPID